MVAVGGHVALVAFEVCESVVVATCESLIVIAHAVALDVGIGDEVDAVLVAEVVPLGVVGVVASAVGIEVQFLRSEMSSIMRWRDMT